MALVWDNPDDIINMIDHTEKHSDEKQSIDSSLKFNDEISQMMYRDLLTYLPDDILCKVDRAAMSVSLETRVPFLDHRVVEFAMKMPLNMKIRDGRGKWALRQILYKYVPQSMLDRPKTGFSIPVGEWLRGPLKDWAEDLMDEEKLIKQGFLNHTTVRQAWILHLSGKNDYTSRIWSVLMFQSWLESQ
jgi:asparagine synthase (glutamine-hydrolysing)